MLFDCGEGTQRQMMRYGVSFALCDIFFTHFHADHVIGVIGLTPCDSGDRRARHDTSNARSNSASID